MDKDTIGYETPPEDSEYNRCFSERNGVIYLATESVQHGFEKHNSGFVKLEALVVDKGVKKPKKTTTKAAASKKRKTQDDGNLRMAKDLTGRVIYLVVHAINSDDDEAIDYNDVGGAAFSTREEARQHMREYGKKLYWRYIDMTSHDVDKEEGELPEPPQDNNSDEYGRFYWVEEDQILMAIESVDGDAQHNPSSCIKVVKVAIDHPYTQLKASPPPPNVASSNKKRKTSG
ncbi:hypothetical protein MBANPS3_003966 [Mucor bainieri]